ncbi:MAG: AtpZ/AtpI family protein [Peptococcaceae bacterium]|nr:AtpZ/AtpI family protein [Peptococcaceae bacterium]
MSMHYKRRLNKDQEIEDKSQKPLYRAFNVATSFGISLAVSLFIMIKVGAWLDQHFQIAPYGSFACVLIAIVAGFRTLYREVLRLEEEDSQRTEKK